MKISKKGFTLTEIIIVVAIIVIISGAAIAGVAVTVAQANERGEQMFNLYGEGNWEKDANATIAALKPTLGPEQIDEADVDGPKEGGNTEDQDKLDPTPTPVNVDPTDPPPTDPPPTDPPPTDPPPTDPPPTDPPPKDPDPETPSGGATQTLNVQMQPNNSTYVSVDESKKIKSITVNWEKTALTNGSFNISYEQSNGFNFYGASQGVQTGYNQYSGSETIYPQANGQQVNCSKLYFSNPSWNSADVKIVSYTIEYED